MPNEKCLTGFKIRQPPGHFVEFAPEPFLPSLESFERLQHQVFNWPNFDLTFQLPRDTDGAGSEFSTLPDRRVAQLLGSYYFQ